MFKRLISRLIEQVEVDVADFFYIHQRLVVEFID